MGDSMATWPFESRAAVVQELVNWQAFVGGDDRAGRRGGKSWQWLYSRLSSRCG